MSKAMAKKEDLSLDQVKAALPRHVRKNVTQKMVDHINNITNDEVLRDMYRENLMSYASVLKDGRFKIQGYLDAVRYVSYKMMGATNIDAYVRTFPERFKKMQDNGYEQRHIASVVSSYGKNMLVAKIFEQTIIPAHVLNADYFQEAINIQVGLMRSAKSEFVRSNAAANLLMHLKPPEEKKLSIDIGVTDNSAIQDLTVALKDLSQKQLDAVKSGTPLEEIASSKIIGTQVEDAEIVE